MVGATGSSVLTGVGIAYVAGAGFSASTFTGYAAAGSGVAGVAGVGGASSFGTAGCYVCVSTFGCSMVADAAVGVAVFSGTAPAFVATAGVYWPAITTIR